MPIVVRGVSFDRYTDWVANKIQEIISEKNSSLAYSKLEQLAS